jgi:hypothetical protein
VSHTILLLLQLTCIGCTTATLCSLRSRLIVASSSCGSTTTLQLDDGRGGAILKRIPIDGSGLRSSGERWEGVFLAFGSGWSKWSSGRGRGREREREREGMRKSTVDKDVAG